MKIVVGEGSCGIAAGAAKVYSAIEKLIGSTDSELTVTGCIGMCFLEPIVDIYDNGELKKRLVKVQPEDAEKIIDYVNGSENAVSDLEISDDDKLFLEKQTRIALRHCGIINPEKIDEYTAGDGYKALEKVLKTMTPEEVIEEIKISGLAGRGGAGFPTWFKWNAARQAQGDVKYLICNADEGDPGAFMDRAVIESDPHNLIEGMLI
ncbi:MAG TPA: NADH-quinone oxidoreductase subunit F, partial [Ruminococcaceae bacterium]|nr:NADH-quinone oxidoreductase subunit F [Oscillospiraceae bacterium]